MILLEELIREIELFEPRNLQLDGARRAAVSLVLEKGRRRPELLFIRRAEHPDDPWSGHMAFPGGRVDDGDADGLAAARRETLEEVGVDLASSARYLGRLSDLQAMGRGRKLALVIEPHVFVLTDRIELEIDTTEVQEALFIPLDHLQDRKNRSFLRWKRVLPLPAIRYDGREIWGLTLRMLDELLALLPQASRDDEP